MSITEYNGAAMVAMIGKNCVAIAADTRFGVQAQTVSTNFQKIFPINPTLYIGLAGLATDVQTLYQRFKFRTNLYKLREEREIKPKPFAHLVSSMLYEKRFGPYFCDPVIAGIDPENGEPSICNMDLIGCMNFAKDFVVAGTCSENLYGMCEALYRENMEPEDLFETISQALVNAFDRDALSGWGAVVHILTPTQVITRTIKTRQD